MLRLGQGAKNRLDYRHIRSELDYDLTQAGNLICQMAFIRVKHRQAFPILGSTDNPLGIVAGAFHGTSPLVDCAPILHTERRGGGYLDQVEVIYALKIHHGSSQAVRRLVIDREMPPKRKRGPVDR